MTEPIQQNGVTFTPHKVVNLDELMNQKPQSADGAVENSSEDLKSEEASDDDSGSKPASADSDTTDTDQSTDKLSEEQKGDSIESSNENNDNKEIDEQEDDNIPLEDLYLPIGDSELSASELVSKYEQISTELDKIKNDEFLSRFVDFYQNGGDPAEYLRKATTDWSKLDDMQLLWMQFNEANADLDQDAKEILFERELLAKYSIGPDGTFDNEDSKEAKLGKQLLKRDAGRLREAKIDEQKKFLLQKNERASQEQPTYDPEAERQKLMSDPELSSIISEGDIKISNGLTYGVDSPEEVIGMMSNVGKFWGLFQKPDGSWDKQAVARVFAFAMNPDKYENYILNLGKAAGSYGYIKDQKNTVEKGKTKVIDKSTDKDSVYVRDGKIVGSNKEDLLKAFVSQKRK